MGTPLKVSTIAVLLLASSCCFTWDPGDEDDDAGVDAGSDGGDGTVLPPSGLSATPGVTSVLLSWTASPTADVSYLVSYGASPVSAGEGETVVISDTQLEVTGLTPGTPHDFHVRALIGFERQSDWIGPATATPLPSPFAVRVTRPAEDETGFYRTSDIELEFTADVEPSSVTVALEPPHPLVVTEGFWEEEIDVDPDGHLAPQTRYRLTVLTATSRAGVEMEAPYTFEFTTGSLPQLPEEVPPEITYTTPAQGAEQALEDSVIQLRFSRAMDRASVEAAWSLSPPVDCSFGWSEDRVTCTPQSPLQTDAGYVLSLDSSARAADDGGLTLDGGYQLAFHTIGFPELVSVTPATGSTGLERSVAVNLQFNKRVRCEEVLSAFTFDSPSRADESSCINDSSSVSINPDSPFAYGDLVQWSLTTAMTDTFGNALLEGASGSFQIARAAEVTAPAVDALDGFVGNQGTLELGGEVITAGATAADEALRGLITFDLSVIPPEALRIASASMSVTQSAIRGDPFDQYSSLIARSVPYGGSPDSTAFAAPHDTRLDCFLFFCTTEPMDYTLSSSAVPGARTIDVLEKVRLDFAERTDRMNRSQFRTFFYTGEADGGTRLDGTENAVDFTSGEGSVGPPALRILYEYP